MAPPLDSAVLADTILRSATEGYYPDSQEIATADLTSSHLPAILKSLQAAKDDVKEQIRAISRDNAASIDSWIMQARQLQADIEASKAKADEILKLDEEEQALAQALGDAEAHQQYLVDEIRFNEALAGMLGKLQLIGTTLSQIDVAAARGELDQAVTILDSAEDALGRLEGFDEIIIVGLMKEKAKVLRKMLLERVEVAWSGLVDVKKQKGTVTISKSFDVSSIPLDLETVIATLDTLGLLRGKIDHFHQQIDRLLIIPRLETQEGCIPTVSVEGNTLRIFGHENDLSARRLFSDLKMIVDFLDSNLPATVMSNLSRILIPNLTNRLISTRLSSSVPPSLDDLPAFEELLEETKRFEDGLHKTERTRERQLSDWVGRAPKVWLAKRRESSLDAARKMLARGIGEVEMVERSETQTIQEEDGQGAMVAGAAGVSGADGWNAAWNDEEDVAPDEQPVAEPMELSQPTQPVQSVQPVYLAYSAPPEPEQSSGFMDYDDDDGMDGWGLDEDLGFDDQDEPEEPAPAPEIILEPPPVPEEVYEDDDMDWGAWGVYADDEEGEGSTKSASRSSKHPRKASISTSVRKASAPPSVRKASISASLRPPPSHTGKILESKDITLTEMYTITANPRALLALISNLLSEATQLQTNPQYKSSPIAPAAPGILTIPTLVLTIFRALAPLYYSGELGSRMYLYNDCIFLSSQLPAEINEKDIHQIVTFGKRQYSHEVDAQRTILSQHLDGAHGFVACTTPQQQLECPRAVSAAISRLRELHMVWKPVLSKSVLYQSLGSLLNAVVTRMVHEIEELGDISEPESVALARYCGDVAVLESELFPTAAAIRVYCAGWGRFRYLEQILGSSMAEIMNLVRQGCLMEFEKEEVVQLVRALFAHSEMRTRCIEDIRREGLY